MLQEQPLGKGTNTDNKPSTQKTQTNNTRKNDEKKIRETTTQKKKLGIYLYDVVSWIGPKSCQNQCLRYSVALGRGSFAVNMPSTPKTLTLYPCFTDVLLMRHFSSPEKCLEIGPEGLFPASDQSIMQRKPRGTRFGQREPPGRPKIGPHWHHRQPKINLKSVPIPPSY